MEKNTAGRYAAYLREAAWQAGIFFIPQSLYTGKEYEFFFIKIMSLVIFVFIIGLFFGSFLNVLIERMYRGENFVWGRSHCPNCRHDLYAYDLIPIVSYILLRGKCRTCKKNISLQYPAAELLTGFVFVAACFAPFSYFSLDSFATADFITQKYGFGFFEFLYALRNVVFVMILLALFLFDLKYFLLPDIITIPSIFFVFFCNAWFGISWQRMLLAAIVAGGFFFLQYAVSGGAWVGGGDIRMGALMGVMLSWPKVLAALLISYVIGSLVCVVLLAMKKKGMKSEVPMGTFLAVGTGFMLLYGDAWIDVANSMKDISWLLFGD
ncbi:MAG: prepilin peptidase [Parcubacteria group bacterium]|nr:prepilin peptidase [Parcubacteria group bacterium]